MTELWANASRTASRHGVAQATLASGFFLAYTLWLVWPMPLDARTTIYGPGGDTVGALTLFRELAQHQVPFVPGRVESLAAPEGLEVRYPLYVATWPSTLWVWLTTILFGAVPAWNLFVVSGLTLTGLSMFLFLRWRIGSAVAGLIIGWAFAFHPSSIFNAATAPDFTHKWILVVVLWRAFIARETPSAKNMLWTAAASLVAISWNPYFLLIATVAVAVLMVCHIGAQILQRRRQALPPRDAKVKLLAATPSLALWLIPLLVAALGYALVAVSAPAGTTGVRERSIADLILYSLRPGEFLNPHNEAVLFGWLTFPGVRPGATTYAYLGLVPTCFALAAIFLATRRRAPQLKMDVITLAALALTGLVWAGPPTANVGPLTVNLPSYYIAELTMTWRIYGRFGVLVEVAVLTLAGYGIAAITARRGHLLGAALASTAAVLTLLDLYQPTLGSTRLQNPPIYSVLRGLPPGPVVEYPIVPAVLGAYEQLRRQDAHQRPLLNGFEPNSPAERRALELTTLDDQTVNRLGRLGIRYVMIDTTYPLAPGQAAPPPVSKLLRFIQADQGFALYEVPGVPALGAVVE
jgi:hypothetical protein